MSTAGTLKVTSPVSLKLPSDFKINEVDIKIGKEPPPPSAEPSPPLGVLSNFTGNFAGHGLNTIFRPNSGPPTTTTFPNPVNPPPPQGKSENVLEINLTSETLSFAQPLGSIPNRGLITQNDIFLNGVPYTQVISDILNPATGKADGKPIGIHFESGLWMHVPATTTDPVIGDTLVRMGSIPHGTTINAQCLAPSSGTAGPPKIPAVDMTPTLIGSTTLVPFISQDASKTDTPRIPQDLTKFIAAGTITQDILTDPNTVLRNANVGKNITETTTFKVSTTPEAPELGGGTANIAFLQGNASGPNASAVQMTATFWIEKVEHKIQVPVFKPGQPPLRIPAPEPHPGAHVPTFVVHPPHEITQPRTITVTSTQIQYSQNVSLNFNGLTWPHISCATLIPTEDQTVPPSAWN
ncbi:hypothetical protein EV356DRAFT_560593 [Viridothelium virens]|uniref:Uncharacterized protein n=1 Tax=Viridothelium virens TaxID=1048519 RepID=A0A6A6H2P4_VIRVR|nr:hypothetical protein EV356DRAFT_560593 [Viridothelium virens]